MMRRHLFGWICSLRGYHKATKAVRAIPLCDLNHERFAAYGVMLEFRCICGNETYRVADVARGGRVQTPVVWETSNVSSQAKTGQAQQMDGRYEEQAPKAPAAGGYGLQPVSEGMPGQGSSSVEGCCGRCKEGDGCANSSGRCADVRGDGVRR